MISYVKGELVAVTEDKVIIDVNGMGYGIYLPSSMLQQMPALGKVVKLHTYLNVREDAMQLFGFISLDALEVYKMLISVSGIGPKGGLAILSKLSVNELRFAVASADVKVISSAQGIGKKTAEKLIIELKDKLSIEDALRSEQDSTALNQSVAHSTGNMNEAIQALVALGYDNSSALKAVKGISDMGDMCAEDILKLALKNLM